MGWQVFVETQLDLLAQWVYGPGSLWLVGKPDTESWYFWAVTDADGNALTFRNGYNTALDAQWSLYRTLCREARVH